MASTTCIQVALIIGLMCLFYQPSIGDQQDSDGPEWREVGEMVREQLVNLQVDLTAVKVHQRQLLEYKENAELQMAELQQNQTKELQEYKQNAELQMEELQQNHTEEITQLEERLRNATEAAATTNIRQCSWVDIDDSRQDGQIKSCSLNKKSSATVLRVVWSGLLRLARPPSGNSACRRWFFKINGAECRTPHPIDGQILEINTDNNIHRHAHLEGLCRDIPAGDVMVTFNVGDCLDMGSMQKGYAWTGWQTTSRFIVEELQVQNPGANIT